MLRRDRQPSRCAERARRRCSLERLRGGGADERRAARASAAPRRRARARATSRSCAQHDARQAARLPRQRRERAEAARGDRRDRRLLRDATTPTSTAASTSSRERATRRYDEARGEGAALPRRAPTRARSSSSATRPRRSTWSRWSCGRAPRCGAGDEVLSPRMEHHSNIVPWQLLCEETGARLRVAPIDDARRAAARRVRGAALRAHAPRRGHARLERARHRATRSREIVALAHARGRPGAGRRRPGGAAHARRRARARLRLLRLLGPQALRARPASACSTAARELLEAMPPWQGGGDMIALGHASRRRPTPSCPQRFEAGTPDIAGAIGLGAAIDYVDGARPRSASPRTSASCSPTATRAARARSPGSRIVGTAPREGRRALLRARRRPPPRRRHDPRPARASRSAPATTARSR